MIDANNREVLTMIYRLIERHETPPKIEFSDDAGKYFGDLLKECKAIIDTFPGNDFARCLSVGAYDAFDERFKAVNDLPLKDRTPEPEQQSLFMEG